MDWQVRADGPFFWNPVRASLRATIIIIDSDTANWNSCLVSDTVFIKTQLQLLMDDGRGISPDRGCGVRAVIGLRGFLMNV